VKCELKYVSSFIPYNNQKHFQNLEEKNSVLKKLVIILLKIITILFGFQNTENWGMQDNN
jgi:hypothetical protein